MIIMIISAGQLIKTFRSLIFQIEWGRARRELGRREYHQHSAAPLSSRRPSGLSSPPILGPEGHWDVRRDPLYIGQRFRPRPTTLSLSWKDPSTVETIGSVRAKI